MINQNVFPCFGWMKTFLCLICAAADTCSWKRKLLCVWPAQRYRRTSLNSWRTKREYSDQCTYVHLLSKKNKSILCVWIVKTNTSLHVTIIEAQLCNNTDEQASERADVIFLFSENELVFLNQCVLNKQHKIPLQNCQKQLQQTGPGHLIVIKLTMNSSVYQSILDAVWQWKLGGN